MLPGQPVPFTQFLFRGPNDLAVWQINRPYWSLVWKQVVVFQVFKEEFLDVDDQVLVPRHWRQNPLVIIENPASADVSSLFADVSHVFLRLGIIKQQHQKILSEKMSPNIILVVLLVVTGVQANHQRIRLADVSALTFRSGEQTTARRGAPIAQLNCLHGCETFYPSTIRCVNAGHDGRDVQWECKTSLPTYLEFDKTDVSCEGFSSPNDSDVLVGSCGLEFSLRRIPIATAATTTTTPVTESGSVSNHPATPTDVVIVGVVVVCCLIFLAWVTGCCSPPNVNVPTTQTVPVVVHHHHQQDADPPFHRRTYRRHTVPIAPVVIANQHHDNPGPGFWTGAAVGTVLGAAVATPPRPTGFTTVVHHHHHQPASTPAPTPTAAQPQQQPKPAAMHEATGYAVTKRR